MLSKRALNIYNFDNFKQTFQIFKYYLTDENDRVSINNNPDLCSNIVLNPFDLKRPSLITQSIAKTLGPFPKDHEKPATHDTI